MEEQKYDTISMEEIRKHNKDTDCWVVINEHIYDLSDWHENHPGGSDIIKNNAGKIVTDIFNNFHCCECIIFEHLNKKI